MEIENINIHSLPSLKIPERYNLPEIGAVYFVLSENNDVEYIGKAKNLRKRWRSHECCMNLDSPKTCRVSWIAIDGENERIEFERRLIHKFNPKNNVHSTIKTPPLKVITETVLSVEKTFLTTKEAAEKLGLSIRAVQKMIESDRLKADLIGRDYLIPIDALDNIERKSNAGRPPKVKSKK